jgi:N-acetylmuramoyl-L-alanine amidase
MFTKLPNFIMATMNACFRSLFTIFLVGILIIPFNGFSQTNKTKSKAIKTVVIDAGHGGKDPGCHGSFALEKVVCLAMSLRLGDLIKTKYPDVKVIYTRDKDVFVELYERANIANRADADLFICIHANAGSSSAYGTETYVLGLHRSESQQKVAESENAIITLEDDKGAKYSDFDMSPDAIIGIQLQMSVNLDNSIRFAELLQKAFKKLGRYDRGVKQAGFLVLYKTTMPSVLIETGFLPNPTEEKFIGGAEGQEKMAQSMFSAFEAYKNQMEGKVVPEIIDSPAPKVVEELVSESKLEIDTNQNKLVFSIQIATSSQKLSLTSPVFSGLKVKEYQQDNLYKYYVGDFINDLDAAKNRKVELNENGFKNAFVIAFLGGERISIEKAIKLAQN